MRAAFVVGALVAVCVVLLGVLVLMDKKAVGGGEAPLKETGCENVSDVRDCPRWWGPGPTPTAKQLAGSERIDKYSIKVPDQILSDLKQRLNKTRYFKPLDLVGDKWAYGAEPTFISTLVEHWQTRYNWRTHEKELNKLPQFITFIDGLLVHYIHIVNKDPYMPVLMLIHGWPGSFVEFRKIIPLLQDHFTLVIPSIPGYGYSTSPQKPGYSSFEASLTFIKLLGRLGYDKYYVQGGDWGSMIATRMAQVDTPRCLGVHLNMYAVQTPPFGLFSALLGYFVPAFQWFHNIQNFTSTAAKLPVILQTMLPLSARDQKTVQNFVYNLFDVTGYMHEQATRPYTISYALTDSPVALCAWIVEKFRDWADLHNGTDPTSVFTRDELLTNVMVYWTGWGAGASVRLYKESYQDVRSYVDLPVFTPTGLASFPRELFNPPLPWARTKYRNIVHFTEMPRGGHFAAMEEPQLLADDIISFVKAVRSSIPKLHPAPVKQETHHDDHDDDHDHHHDHHEP